ncbi:tetratricopeptide repeat protein [Pararobbsia silviterrae]|uniref:Uncharacterized protein n=1 Tax=Pararobbsia silviterrae TaxID=1792498 RepID=A0A494XCN6_9BURK|nr:tetratricopeptide repeat protein [Pararobbsia silviterrae]RKP45333.1 hypothetical protein D7S86_26160 [Pararobbsia silviterrae]
MDQYAAARAALDKKQLGAAERGFNAILKTSPRHIPAMRGLAIVRFMQKRVPDALALVRKAIDADPADVESHLQLAEFQLALKKLDEALAIVERACDAHVDSLIAWATLVRLYRLQGREDEMESRMLRALDANPDAVELMFHIGNMYGKTGDHERARAMFDRLLAVRPDHVEGRLQFANSLYFLKRYDAAFEQYEAVLRLDASRHFAWSQMGNVRLAQKRFPEALIAFQQALEVEPKSYDALIGAGATLWSLDHLDEAMTFARAALEVSPRGVAAFNNIGQVMAARKDDANAIAMFDRVHEIEPDSTIDAKISAAVSCLRLGRYAEGWRRYESRIPLDGAPVVERARYAGARRWNGEDLSGKTLLIVPEQGIGDTIQFSRFVPMVVQATRGRVVFAVNAPLFALFEDKAREWGPAGNLTLVTHKDALPPCDYFVPLMSLPLILGTRVETIPSAPRYLSAPERYRAKWQTALPDRGRLRIGLAWAGNPNHVNDRNRSMPIRFLAPLVSDASVDWCVIQPGLTEFDQRSLATVPHVLNAGPHLQDFGDTAALLDVLDVVVAVDTSVAHLAGALGRPLFLLLPWAAEWRWFHDRTDTPWYPSARLFRQPSLGDWEAVVDDVQKALIDFARAKAARTAAPPIQLGHDFIVQ